MSFNIGLTSNGVIVRDSLGKIRSKFGRVAIKDLKKVTEIHSRELGKDAPEWQGILKRKLRRVKRAGKGYRIEAPGYSFWLNFMRPHTVGPNTAGRESLDQWMLSKFGVIFPFLRVKPRRWISPALERAKIATEEYVTRNNNRLSKLMQSKGVVG